MAFCVNMPLQLYRAINKQIYSLYWLIQNKTVINNLENGQDSELAEKLVLEQRVYTNHAFRSALSDSRSEQEKEKIVDLFYSR